MNHGAAPDARGRRLVAPIGLVLAVALIALLGRALVADLQVSTITVPVASTETAADAIPEPGPEVAIVLQTDALSPDVVELLEAVTNQTADVAGVVGVDSVTDVGILTNLPPAGLTSTPAFGSESKLDASLDLETRARRASIATFGSAGLLSADGRTFLIAAEIDPRLSDDGQAAAARAVRDQAALAVSVSGLPVQVSFGGEALTTAESTDDMRTDLTLLVGLAVVAPAAIALVLLRRRVPAGAVLAAGGAALLLAALLVNGEAAQGATAPLDRDDPVTLANQLVDQHLRGTVPVTIDVTGAPGAFRRPDVLARMDALTTWLRDEYGVSAIDLPTTLRSEAGAITGVDSIPSNPEDIASLLQQTAAFGDGQLLADITNADLSRTRIVAWVPDEGRARLDELADRLDRISVVVFEDLGISARVAAEVVSTATARQQLADDLALLGSLAIALGATVALATVWDRHRHEERHRAHHRRLFGVNGHHPTAGAVGHRLGHGSGDHRWSSLFARHGHEHHDDDPDDSDDAAADRFARQRRASSANRS